MKNFLSTLSLAVASLTLLLVTGATSNSDKSRPFSESDDAAIRATLERYRTGWLAGDAEAVRSTFTKDAVLLPHHGVPPVAGMAAINEFWFAPSATKRTITRFAQTLDEVGGDGTLGYARGRSEVAWTIEETGKKQNWQNAGNFLAIFKKHGDSRWLISHLIWNDPPNQQVN